MALIAKGSGNLVDLLEQKVYPRLSVDQVYPDEIHHWKVQGKDWKGSCPFHSDQKSGTAFSVTAENLLYYCGKCGGGDPVHYLWRSSGNPGNPTGKDFVDIVRNLCIIAGVPFPEREYTPEEEERFRRTETRRSVLSLVYEYGERTLWSTVGAQARAYLTKERGLTEDEVKSLHLGYYHSAEDLYSYLQDRGADLDEAKEAGFPRDKWEGYVLFPWVDEHGRPLTLYGRWREKVPPEGRPKTLALSGEGTKRSPLYYDRAKKEGHKDLVLVEGLMDAALLQVRGDTRAVSQVAAVINHNQVETLVRDKVRKVFVCGDPDGGGDKGNLDNVTSLSKAGIQAFVVPRLPEGMDPDEWVRENGIDAWKERVEASVTGSVFKAEKKLKDVTPESPPHAIQDAVDEVLGYVETLTGDRASLDQEDVIRLLSERTGYSEEALDGRVQDLHIRREKEDRNRTMDGLLRDASRAREGGKDALLVAQKLQEGLSPLQSRDLEAPSWFSVDRLDEVSRNIPLGLWTGWDALDALEVRFNPGELSLLAARTGHGKTSALVNLLLNWFRSPFLKGDEVFVLYSHEEAEARIYHRLLSVLTAMEGGEPNGWTPNEVKDYLRDPRSRPFKNVKPDLLETAKERLRDLEGRLLVANRPSWDALQVSNHARTLAQDHTLGGVLVDYLQRVSSPPGHYDRRDVEVSTVGRMFKTLSVDLNVPVVMGAQVNREAVPSAYKELSGKSWEEAKKIIKKGRPDVHNLREGGSEQEADLILGLLNYAADYREDALTEALFDKLPDETLFEVGVLKNRYGPQGRWVPLDFVGKYGLLRDQKQEENLK